MRLTTIGYALVAILILTVCITRQEFYSSYKCFYVARFFYAYLMPATIILPTIYLFNRWPASQHILIGTYIVLAMFIGRFLSRTLAYWMPHSQMKVWCFLAIAITCIPFVIYAHVEKYSSSTTNKSEKPKKHSISLRDKMIYTFIGFGWSVVLVYNYTFITPYLKNICIFASAVKKYNLLSGSSVFYVTQLLFLYPAAKICEKFGAAKTMVASLIYILILGLIIPFIIPTIFCLIPQILLAFFSACLFAPSLVILYQLFTNTKSVFDTVFWFTLGSSISTLCLSLGSRFGFVYHFPLAGMWVFVEIILICLIGIFGYTKNKEFII